MIIFLIFFTIRLALVKLYGTKNPYIYTLGVFLSSVSFISILYILSFKYIISSSITSKLGKYSYEIYLSQGIVYLIIENMINNDLMFWIYYVLIMILLVILEKIIIQIFYRKRG